MFYCDDVHDPFEGSYLNVFFGGDSFVVDARIKHHLTCEKSQCVSFPFCLKIDIFGAGILVSTALVFTFNHFNFALFDKFTGFSFLLHDPTRVILFLFLFFSFSLCVWLIFVVFSRVVFDAPRSNDRPNHGRLVWRC